MNNERKNESCSVCDKQLGLFSITGEKEDTVFCSFECQAQYCTENDLTFVMTKSNDFSYIKNATN